MPITRPLGPTLRLACAHASSPDLPSAPMTTTVCPWLREPRDLRGRAGDVEHGERNVARDVVGKLCVDPRFEQDRAAAQPDAPGRHVDPFDGVDRQRRQRQRNERRDRGRLRAARRGRAAPRRSRDAADEHAAAAGHRIVLLAALAHGRDDVLRDACGIAVADRRDLTKRRRVDVERLDVAENLVGVGVRRRVDPPGGLRQRACRFEDAMRPEPARRSLRDGHGETARNRETPDAGWTNSSSAIPPRS